MPAVKAPHGRAVVVVVVVVHPLVVVGVVGIPQKRGAVSLLYRPSPLLVGEAPGPAEVVFRAGAADGGVVLVPVDVKLHLPLAPPVALQGGQGQVRAHVLPLSPHPVQHHVVLGQVGDGLPPPLGVEVAGVLRQLRVQAVVDLIEKRRHRVFVLVLHREPGGLPEGHGEVAVKAPVGVDRHGQGIDQAPLAEAAAEKVPQGRLYRRGLLPVPVHAQHQVPQHEPVGVAGLVRHGDPDVLDHPWAFHLPQQGGLPWLDLPDAGRPLPGGSQVAGGGAALALLPPGVLRVDGPALPAGEIGQAP